MGRKSAKIQVLVSLSDHNDPERDGADLDLFYELAAEVKRIARDPKYAQILDWVAAEESG